MSTVKLFSALVCTVALTMGIGVSAEENPFAGIIPLTPENWNNPSQEQVSLTNEADGSLQLTVKPGGSKDWIVLDGPSLSLAKRDRFIQGRYIKIEGEAKTAGAVPSYALQLRAKQNGGRYAWNKAPHYLWETSLEITKAEKMPNWAEVKNSAAITNSCDKLNFELWLAVPKEMPYTISLRNLKVKESFKRANLIVSSPFSDNNIFFKDDGIMKVEFADTDKLASWSIRALDELDRVLLTKEGKSEPGEQTVILPGRGFYRIVAVGIYEDGSKLENSVTASVVGEPLPDSIRLKSRFGSCRVHGNGEVWK